MARTIVCFGDSNTYGYDPADWETGRYSPDLCWSQLLQRNLGPGWKVLMEGLNGRKIPDLHHDRDVVLRMLRLAGPEGFLVIMLGTNDLLMTFRPDASVPAHKMEKLLAFISEEERKPELLLIAPVPAGSADHPDELMQRYYKESLKMNRSFADLAERYGAYFADAAEWEIERTFDYVHFSEKGHASFAEHITEQIFTLMKGRAQND